MIRTLAKHKLLYYACKRSAYAQLCMRKQESQMDIHSCVCDGVGLALASLFTDAVRRKCLNINLVYIHKTMRPHIRIRCTQQRKYSRRPPHFKYVYKLQHFKVSIYVMYMPNLCVGDSNAVHRSESTFTCGICYLYYISNQQFL